jgi:cytochrome c-type biogenesis protein CcmH/NrfG
MKLESIVYAIAGVCFGLIAGWIIGAQQAIISSRTATPPIAQSTPQQTPPAESANTSTPAILDESKVQALRTVAERDPKNAAARAQLGNVYYDAGRYPDAIKWYGESLTLNPKDVNVSTDLGVSYYYNNQIDLAIRQLEHSLELDPRHAKSLLNLGVVRAFGKQDLKGATEVWRRLVEIAPESPEGRQARKALDSLSSAHQNLAQ